MQQYIYLKLAQLCLNHFVFKRVIAYHLVLAAILGNTLSAVENERDSAEESVIPLLNSGEG